MVGGQRWALLSEAPDGPPAPEVLARRLAPVDLVLVEGFKGYDFAKLEVHRPSLGKPALWPDAAGTLAVATDAALLAACPFPLLPLNDPAAIARWAAAFARAPVTDA